MVESEKKYGYVLETIVNEQIYTKEGFGTVTATNHAAVITALVEALKRFKKPCKLFIHTESAFVNNMISMRLEEWARQQYKNAKGEQIKNYELWESLGREALKHEYITVTGEHEYSDWLKRQMEEENV